MKKAFYSLFLFLSLCHDGYTQGHTDKVVQTQPSNEELIVSLAENNKDIVGVYVLDRTDKRKEDVESFPNRTEYERIVIRKKNKKYEVIYFGARLYSTSGLIPLEEDISLYYFFASKAGDVRMEGNRISFAIKDRYMFPLEHAPRNSKEAEKLKSNHLYLFKISSPIFMNGVVGDHMLTIRCQGVDCVSDDMVFPESNEAGSQQF